MTSPNGVSASSQSGNSGSTMLDGKYGQYRIKAVNFNAFHSLSFLHQLFLKILRMEFSLHERRRLEGKLCGCNNFISTLISNSVDFYNMLLFLEDFENSNCIWSCKNRKYERDTYLDCTSLRAIFVFSSSCFEIPNSCGSNPSNFKLLT